MKKIITIFWLSVTYFAIDKIADAMEHNTMSVDQKELLACYLTVNEGEGEPLLINDKIRFWRKYEKFASPVNVVLSSYFDKEELADTAIRYVKKQAAKIKGLIEWRIVPTTIPLNMGDLLKQNGFDLKANSCVMIYHLDDDIQTKTIDESIYIERLTDAEDIPVWVAIIERAFDAPWCNDSAYRQYIAKGVTHTTIDNKSVEYYSGYYNNQLAATAGLLIQGNYGYIYALATDELFRKKGLATHIILTLLKRAKALDLKYVMVEGDTSLINMYKNVGFHKAFDVDIYVYCH